MADVTANQHHVWQYHLKAWANSRDQVWCLQQGKPSPFLTHTRNVGSERFFYESQELEEADEQRLDWVINQSDDEELRKLNRGWVDAFQMPFTLRRMIERLQLTDSGRTEIEKELDNLRKTLGEDFHGDMEKRGKPMLDSLRYGDVSFYRNHKEQQIHFIQFICLQYFRTRKIRNGYYAIPLDFPYNREKTWPIEAFIYATNLGTSLFAQRHQYDLVMIENQSDTPFVTGDQPVINLLTHMDQHVELFFPLTPKRAVIFSTNKERFPSNHTVANAVEVANYNLRIFQKSDTQLYGSNKGYLGTFMGLPKGDMNV